MDEVLALDVLLWPPAPPPKPASVPFPKFAYLSCAPQQLQHSSV